MNRFSVNPLGGFNPVQAVTNIKQQNRQQDAQEAQLQADRDKKIAFANAATGNPESMRKLAEVDPNLFQWMDQRNSKRAEVEGAENAAVKQQTEQQWLIRYNQALESEDEQAKQALMQEAISDPNNDLEHGAIGKDPEADKTITKAILFNSMGKDAYSQFYGDGGAGKKLDPTANMQDFSTYQDLKKTDPEAAKRFGQKVGFVTKEGRELSPYHQKQLTKYSDSAVEAESLANEFNVIANDFEKLDPVSGAAGGAYEFLKEATGAEDAVSELKRKYLKIRASQLVKNLPPGARGLTRSGNTAQDLSLSNQNVLNSLVNQRLAGVSTLANQPLNTNAIANSMSGIGRTMGQGQIAQANAMQQGYGGMFDAIIQGTNEYNRSGG